MKKKLKFNEKASYYGLRTKPVTKGEDPMKLLKELAKMKTPME